MLRCTQMTSQIYWLIIVNANPCFSGCLTLLRTWTQSLWEWTGLNNPLCSQGWQKVTLVTSSRLLSAVSCESCDSHTPTQGHKGVTKGRGGSTGTDAWCWHIQREKQSEVRISHRHHCYEHCQNHWQLISLTHFITSTNTRPCPWHSWGLAGGVQVSYHHHSLIQDGKSVKRDAMTGARGNKETLQEGWEKSWWKQRETQCCEWWQEKKMSVLTGPSRKWECVFNVTVLGVKVQWRLWRVMFGIPHNCV